MKLRRFILRTAVTLAVVWAIACLGLVLSARTLIYPFRAEPSATMTAGVPGAVIRTFTGEGGVEISAWIVPPKGGRPVILYFMGNAGSLISNGPRLSELVHRGFGIAALNYRGAGEGPGEPTQETLTSDALAFYDQLDRLIGQAVAPSGRVIYGTSLGAALAVQVAAERQAAALVLETPFNRMCEVAEFHYPIFPACLVLPYERWPSADLIARVEAPLLIQHGDADQTIPLSQGRALFDAANQPKRLIVYPGGRHNDLRLRGAGIDAINFIEALAAD
jgi:fermentation-respiration switch protein FrsA (DUF1100 family)